MKNKKLISFNILIFVAFCLTFSINKAYAVTFKDPFDIETYAECETENGKLTQECGEVLRSICGTWVRYYVSTECCTDNQLKNCYNGPIIDSHGYERTCSPGESYSVDELMNATSLRATYYCRANSSIHHSGCYVCSNNSSIYKWESNDGGWGAADSRCSGGYRRVSSITSEANCNPATPTPTPTATPTPTPTATPTPTPTPASACYVCKTNSTIMEWRTNGNADSKCSSGYNKDTTKNQANCKPTEKACYVCKNDNNVMKWGNNGTADDKCSVGYNKTNTPEKNCVSNPKTGSTVIGISWFIGIFALSYAIIYFISFDKKSVNKK